MEKDLIVGIIYSKFDAKIGPHAQVWLPNDLSDDIKDKISFKSDRILTGEEGLMPKSLAVVPIPSLSLKTVIKSMVIKDFPSPGSVLNTSLTLLFEEGDDLIFYKYINNIEPIINETAGNLIELEKRNAEKGKFLDELKNFNKSIANLFHDLRETELSHQKQEVFPKLDGIDVKLNKYRFKIIIIGDSMVGKTSVVLSFTDKAFRRTYVPTLGVNISEKIVKVNGSLVEFIIWDIAGQEKFNMMRKHFYQSADAQILMLDMTRRKTFYSINTWYEDTKEHLGKNTPGLIIANKLDLKDKREVSTEELIALEKELNLKWLETSALTGENVDESFLNLAETLINIGKKPVKK